MLVSFDQVNTQPNLKHYFFIPYDPHGLQLLIKDILQYLAYAPTIKVTAQLIEHLYHADKQYQTFKEIQQQFPGKHRTLVRVANTRWGNYTKAFQRIIENIGALRV
jgi:hypothetical protein